MDVQKTMEFLLESAARHDTQMIAIRNVIEGGMKLIASQGTKIDMLLDAQLRGESRSDRIEGQLERIAVAQAATEEELKRLAEAQAVTEQKLQSFIDSLKRPRNGHTQ